MPFAAFFTCTPAIRCSTGRVSARLVIGRDGKVKSVADGGSDIPDAEVVSCALKAFSGLEFPPPANGIVTVVYPIMLASG